MTTKKSLRVPNKIRPKYDAIVKLTDAICSQHLNQEYAEYARYLAAALARKRPSPIARGAAKSWAAGIVHALGFVNFLTDPSFEPHMSTADLWKAFNVSKATGGNKSRDIRNLFDMYQFDPEWTLPSMTAQNPMMWMVQTPEGMIVDARQLPLEIQQLLVEQGVIPYVAEDAVSLFDGETGELLFELEDDEDDDEFDVIQTNPNKNIVLPIVKGKKQCQLCGNTKKLMRTSCCNQWICDDHEDYVMFSYARNSCARNHDRYTICALHFNEGHEGRWQDCQACRDYMETEMYVYHATNEYNFEVLENPPTYEPTHCSKCNEIIILADGGYSMSGDGYTCMNCNPLYK